MLHAEQCGLDHNLLYSLARFTIDTPSTLQATYVDNPLVQYQVIPEATRRHGQPQKVLQAGTPYGLLAYLYAQ